MDWFGETVSRTLLTGCIFLHTKASWTFLESWKPLETGCNVIQRAMVKRRNKQKTIQCSSPACVSRRALPKINSTLELCLWTTLKKVGLLLNEQPMVKVTNYSNIWMCVLKVHEQSNRNESSEFTVNAAIINAIIINAAVLSLQVHKRLQETHSWRQTASLPTRIISKQ